MSHFERDFPVESVLILDDDRDDLEALRTTCLPRLTWATSLVNDALAIARRERPQLVVVDLWLGPQQDAPQMSRKWYRDVFGIDVIRQLREDNSETIIVLYSRSVSNAHRAAALAAGANGAVPKLIGPEKLLMIVEGGQLERQPKAVAPSLKWKNHDYVAERYLANNRNARATAEELGVSEATLYRMLRSSVPER